MCVGLKGELCECVWEAEGPVSCSISVSAFSGPRMLVLSVVLRVRKPPRPKRLCGGTAFCTSDCQVWLWKVWNKRQEAQQKKRASCRGFTSLGAGIFRPLCYSLCKSTNIFLCECFAASCSDEDGISFVRLHQDVKHKSSCRKVLVCVSKPPWAEAVFIEFIQDYI